MILLQSQYVCVEQLAYNADGSRQRLRESGGVGLGVGPFRKANHFDGTANTTVRVGRSMPTSPPFAAGSAAIP